MPGDYQLVNLPNGAVTIRSCTDQETFHPVIGPAAEAEALYLKQLDLSRRVRAAHSGDFIIWDVGLGAAANALTVLRGLDNLRHRIRLLSFDKTLEPLKFALNHSQQLSYFRGFEPEVAQLLAEHRAFDGHWQVVVGDFPAWIRAASNTKPSPNAILFDPFSPARNPAMWTAALFSDLFRQLDPRSPCALATYSRSTMLRVTLLCAGFYVGIGHPTGEKEETTIAANTLALLREPLPRKWLARAAKSKSAEPLTQPVYRQAPLSPETWERLQHHPQFV